jgi:16S rRNA (guanine966-N2)-methyltransferase
MRISGGTAKGRRTATKRLLIKKADGKSLRPTSSKVREALFDILGNRIIGASFLDLYAGSGTVGFEALSRGAGTAVFVESDAMRVRAIRNIAEELGFLERSVIRRDKASGFLRKAASENRLFDIIFADPPYHSDELNKVLPLIDEGRLLSEGGVVAAEHFSREIPPDSAGSLKKKKTYRYGDTTLTFYARVMHDAE